MSLKKNIAYPKVLFLDQKNCLHLGENFLRLRKIKITQE